MSSESNNIVLDKIPCLFSIEWDSKINQPVITTEEPRIPLETIIHISYKLDGECCYFAPSTGIPLRRRDLGMKAKEPEGWIQTGELDAGNKHRIGFLPIETDPNAKWMKTSIDFVKKTVQILNAEDKSWITKNWSEVAGRTAEFMGEKVQGNSFKLKGHGFYLHGDWSVEIDDKFRENIKTFSAIKQWFLTQENENKFIFEGLVLRSKDGKLYKITRAHLKLPWP
jgi:hypothetical protein